MITIMADENKGIMVAASGQLDTVAAEIVGAIQKLCDEVIKKDGREAGVAFSEAIISALEDIKGMRTEEVLKSQALKPSEEQEDLERTQRVINLWNDIAGGKHGTD